MSRTYHGGNSAVNRAISGRQRGEPEFGGKTPEKPTKIHPALLLLQEITPSMTKGAMQDQVTRAIKKLGG